MEYYVNLLVKGYKAQLLISPPTAEVYTVRARRKATDEWSTSTHELLSIALFQVSNQLYEQDQKLAQPVAA